jgi:hypothetical protein
MIGWQQQQQQMQLSNDMEEQQNEEKLKQSVMNEIEDQFIKPDKINLSSKGMLNQKQVYVDSIKKSDALRGGKKFKCYTASNLYFRRVKTRSSRQLLACSERRKQSSIRAMSRSIKITRKKVRNRELSARRSQARY